MMKGERDLVGGMGLLTFGIIMCCVYVMRPVRREISIMIGKVSLLVLFYCYYFIVLV